MNSGPRDRCGAREGMRARMLSCPTLCDPMDCGLPGSSVHGILQARRPELVAISSSRGSSRTRDGTHISHAFSGGFFTASTPWEAPEEERWNTSPVAGTGPVLFSGYSLPRPTTRVYLALSCTFCLHFRNTNLAVQVNPVFVSFCT